MILALFDFDGTITRKDSFIHFIIFALGVRRFITGLLVLSPFLIAYKLKVISNSKAKEIVFGFFFRGWNADRFKEIAYNYSRDKLPLIVRKTAMKRIKWHKQEGHKVVIVSASIDDFLKNWCDMNELDLIATKIEVKDGKLTGKFLSKNCYGQEKVSRLKDQFNLTEFEYIYAYGDSRGDREMFALANEVHHAYF
jgi:HAD superfamily hydrolase (TIGR01490 family)